LPARAYANGTGVPRDERRATELWERACAGGVPSACDEIDAGE
jgi:TPR repeat protein